jgi:hypothetical protein
MKVLVVNDCAHVMEDLIPYLSSKFDIQFIQRSRGLWSKTFGVLWKIAKSKGDLWHVSYALQDAYLVDKFKHLDILHCHGSDVRWTIHSRKYGWIVKHNLKKAKKVLYATPDLESAVKQYREDAIYLPTPVRTDVFAPKQHYNNPLKAVYFKLPYEQLPLELDLFLRVKGITLDILERNVPYEKMPETLRQYDIFIDRFSIPSFSKTALEAMASGLVTVDYRHRENIVERLDMLMDTDTIRKEVRDNRRVIENFHNVSVVANQLRQIWDGMLNGDT